jgi:hypothetical protein
MTTIDRSSRSRDEAGGNCAFNIFDRPCREHTRLINRTRTTLNRGAIVGARARTANRRSRASSEDGISVRSTTRSTRRDEGEKKTAQVFARY